MSAPPRLRRSFGVVLIYGTSAADSGKTETWGAGRGAALAAPTAHSPLVFWTISSETALGTSA